MLQSCTIHTRLFKILNFSRDARNTPVAEVEQARGRAGDRVGPSARDDRVDDPHDVGGVDGAVDVVPGAVAHGWRPRQTVIEADANEHRSRRRQVQRNLRTEWSIP